MLSASLSHGAQPEAPSPVEEDAEIGGWELLVSSWSVRVLERCCLFRGST